MLTVLLLAIGVYLAGWAVVCAAWRVANGPSAPPRPTPIPMGSLVDDRASLGKVARETGEPGDSSSQAAKTPTPTPAPAVSSDAGPDGGLAKTLLPGEIPAGMAVQGGTVYSRCWDRGGLEHPGRECDRLPRFEQSMLERLYVADRCREQSAGSGARGSLVLGVELDLNAGRTSIWADSRGDLSNGIDVARCMHEALGHLPLDGLAPRYARYEMEYRIRFESPTAPAVVGEVAAAGEDGAQAPATGPIVTVVRDHVRVRTRPVDGAMLGKLSSGARVMLLEQRQEWCRVITPQRRMGWMVCWALENGAGEQSIRP